MKRLKSDDLLRECTRRWDIVHPLPLSGWAGIVISMIAFLFFTDMCIYWIHRFLHHKLIYKVS